MNKDLVSVIIATFNRADFINDTVQSILEQNYSMFEIIVIDDGSTDNTKDLISRFGDKRIKYFWQENKGLPAIARNRGVSFAQGEYLAFLDSDDIWLPKKLDKQMEIIKKNPNITFVSTNAFYIYGYKRTGIPMIKKLKTGYFSDDNFFPVSKVVQSSVLMRRDHFFAIGGFNESPDLKAIEDYDLWVRLYSKYPCFYLNKCLVGYRKHQMSISGDELQKFERNLHYYYNYFSKYGFSENINKRVLVYILRSLSFAQFLSGGKNWKNNFKKSWFSNPSLIDILRGLLFLLPHKLAAGIFKFKRNVIDYKLFR